MRFNFRKLPFKYTKTICYEGKNLIKMFNLEDARANTYFSFNFWIGFYEPSDSFCLRLWGHHLELRCTHVLKLIQKLKLKTWSFSRKTDEVLDSTVFFFVLRDYSDVLKADCNVFFCYKGVTPVVSPFIFEQNIPPLWMSN